MRQPKENPDDIIQVWQITPHLTDSSFDSCIIRGWGAVCVYIRNHIDSFLDGIPDGDLLSGGVSVKFELTEMTLGDYLDIKENTF